MTPSLPRELLSLQRRVRILEVAPRLASASLEGASIPSFDRDGNLKAIIGQQPDGSHTVVVKDGPTPLQPTDPTCEPGPLVIAVTWDGNLIGPFGTVDAELDVYADFEACEVHVGTAEGYFPDTSTLAGVLGRQGGRVAVPSPAGQVWVRLVIRSQAGKHGPPSPSVPVEVEPLVDPQQFDDALAQINDAAVWIADSGAVLDTLLSDETGLIPIAVIDHLWTNVVRSRQITTDMLIVGSGENLVPDPHLTNPDLTTARLAASSGAWVTAEDGAETVAQVAGNSTSTLRWVAAPGGVEERSHPVTPGHTYRLRYDARLQGKGFGIASSRPVVRWVNAAGSGTTVYPRATTAPMGDSWLTDEVEWTAPEGAVGAYLGVVVSGGASSHQLQVRRPSVTSKTDASLIVDGSIAARHVNAQSVAAVLGEFITVKASNLEAGTINVALDLGVAGSVEVGSEAAGGVTRIEGGPSGGVRFYIPNIPDPISELGKNFVTRNAAGDITASMNGADGSVAAEVGEFGVLRVGGVDVTKSLSSSSRLILDDQPGTYRLGPYNSAGYREIGFTAEPGHVYRVENWLNVLNVSTTGTFFAYLRETSSSSGPAPVPLISSPSPASDDTSITGNAEGRFRMSYFHVNDTALPRNVRVLVQARAGGGRTFDFIRSAFAVTDMGEYEPQVVGGRWSLGGASGTVPVPAPPPQKYTDWWDLDWKQVYQFTGFATDPAIGAKLRTGRVGGNANYPFATLLRIPDAMRTELMGASVVKVWLQVTNIGWQTAPVVVGQATNTSIPSQFPTPTGMVVAGTLGRSATGLFLLPSAWDSRWKAGTNRSLTLGRLDSNGSNDMMAEFAGIAASAATRVRLFAEWQK